MTALLEYFDFATRHWPKREGDMAPCPLVPTFSCILLVAAKYYNCKSIGQRLYMLTCANYCHAANHNGLYYFNTIVTGDLIAIDLGMVNDMVHKMSKQRLIFYD